MDLPPDSLPRHSEPLRRRSFRNLVLTLLLAATLSSTLTAGASSSLTPAKSSERTHGEIAPQEKAAWELWAGEQRLWRAGGRILRFSIGGPALRAVRLPSSPSSDPSQMQDSGLLIKGVTPGAADVWIWKSDGSSEFRRITVLPPPTTLSRSAPPSDPRVQERLAQALRILTLDEAQVLRTETGALLRGRLTRREELEHVSALVRGFPGGIRDETTLAPALLQTLEEELRELLPRLPLPKDTLQLDLLAGNHRIRGTIEDVSLRESILREIRSVHPRVELQIEGLTDEAPVVRFQVYLVEIRRTAFQRIGLNGLEGIAARFQGALASGALPSGNGQTQIELLLQALESEGEARVLSRPELVVRAPGEAELFAGGEIPIRTHSQFSSQITWKNFGLVFKLKVLQARGNKTRLELLSELSRLDPTLTPDAIPGLQSNRLRTEVDAEFGVPLFLSGLFREDRKTLARGIPGLRSLPILGALFGSEEFLEEKSELIAVLLPEKKIPALSTSQLPTWGPRPATLLQTASPSAPTPARRPSLTQTASMAKARIRPPGARDSWLPLLQRAPGKGGQY